METFFSVVSFVWKAVIWLVVIGFLSAIIIANWDVIIGNAYVQMVWDYVSKLFTVLAYALPATVIILFLFKLAIIDIIREAVDLELRRRGLFPKD